MTAALAKLDAATRMLAEIRTVVDAKRVVDMAEAARTYARKAQLGLEAQNHAAEIKLKAERKAGELLAKMEKNRGGRGKGTADTLSAVLGTTRTRAQSQSSRWQAIATLPQEAFDAYLDDPKTRTGELTEADLLRMARQASDRERRDKPAPVSLPEGVYSVVVIDPPWQYSRGEDTTHRGRTPYPTMSLDEIGLDIENKLIVPGRLAEDAVIWIWTTNAFMHEAYHLLERWGVEPKTVLTWAKPKMGVGNWLRGQTEHCILSIRGKPIVRLTNQTTLLAAPAREHSRKPDEFYALVDQLCVGPKLDWYSREPRDGWAQFGNEPEAFRLSAVAVSR